MSEVDSLQQRVTKLEEVLAHHQHTVEQLNKVIVAMQSDYDRLLTEHKRQQGRIDWLSANVGGDDLPHEKPPHY